MLYLFSIAIGFQLDRYELVYSGQSGIFQGVSYADANAKFLAFNVMTILAAFAGTLFLLFCFTKWWIPLTVTVVVWIGASWCSTSPTRRSSSVWRSIRTSRARRRPTFRTTST